ncbi:hypothetical protein SAMN04488118_104330 [Epibacterium ulvae]|uniref:Uncharacterized protein n=1 Tax=Epibacterium ulvae TaxID=1156985 RepID=A0A1G5QKB9_9RHOB|nr:hypothetical protein SAMN04488118_104330 [Epibacterium ulvae]
MASARVIGPNAGGRGDLLIRWNLRQQVGQCWGVADVACRDLDPAESQYFSSTPK